MNAPKKAKDILLAAALLGGLLLSLLNGWMTYGVFSTLCGLLPLCTPFLALQLFLCRFCRSQLLRAAPVLLSGLGILGSLGYMVESSGFEALTGLFILFPSILGLMGSALGWLVWRVTQNRP